MKRTITFLFALAFAGSMFGQVAITKINSNLGDANHPNHYVVTAENGVFKGDKCDKVFITKAGTAGRLLEAGNVKVDQNGNRIQFDAGVNGDAEAGKYDVLFCGEQSKGSTQIEFLKAADWDVHVKEVERDHKLDRLVTAVTGKDGLQTQIKSVQGDLADVKGKLSRFDNLSKDIEDLKKRVTDLESKALTEDQIRKIVQDELRGTNSRVSAVENQLGVMSDHIRNNGVQGAQTSDRLATLARLFADDREKELHKKTLGIFPKGEKTKSALRSERDQANSVAAQAKPSVSQPAAAPPAQPPATPSQANRF